MEGRYGGVFAGGGRNGIKRLVLSRLADVIKTRRRQAPLRSLRSLRSARRLDIRA